MLEVALESLYLVDECHNLVLVFAYFGVLFFYHPVLVFDCPPDPFILFLVVHDAHVDSTVFLVLALHLVGHPLDFLGQQFLSVLIFQNLLLHAAGLHVTELDVSVQLSHLGREGVDLSLQSLHLTLLRVVLSLSVREFLLRPE